MYIDSNHCIVQQSRKCVSKHQHMRVFYLQLYKHFQLLRVQQSVNLFIQNLYMLWEIFKFTPENKYTYNIHLEVPQDIYY